MNWGQAFEPYTRDLCPERMHAHPSRYVRGLGQGACVDVPGPALGDALAQAMEPPAAPEHELDHRARQKLREVLRGNRTGMTLGELSAATGIGKVSLTQVLWRANVDQALARRGERGSYRYLLPEIARGAADA